MSHAWNVDPQQAAEIQRKLRSQVHLEPFHGTPRLMADCDVSFNRFSDVIFAGFVVMTWPEMEIVQVAAVKDVATFPYVPGFLSFREIPALLKAWERIRDRPDLLFVDGIGIAHPPRLGIASHLSVLLDVPAIGCAKSVLTGAYEEPGCERGDRSPLRDRSDPADIFGTALRTKRNVKPMFVSPGHRTDVESSAALVLAATRAHRIPEPTRQAHLAMNAFRVQDGSA